MFCDKGLKMDISHHLHYVAPLAPKTEEVTEYDRAHFLTYARLLDAANLDTDWRGNAETILGVKQDMDEKTAWQCWGSHLARARWIIGDGLALAIEAKPSLDGAKANE